MKTLVKIGLTAMSGVIGLCLNVKAQELAKKTDTDVVKKDIPFDINLQLRSNYIWRGFKVSDAPITDVDIHYDFTKSKSLSVGVWGGTSFTGDYKEFDYYVSYTKPTYSFSIWDVNNFSNFPNADIFNYNPSSTSHFIDVRAGYKFGNSFPLSIDWATIILGRDTHPTDNGNVANSYSNYVELGYRFWKFETTELHVFVAGGFAFGRQANFYGSKPNIVNTGVTLNKDLIVFKYHIPMAATAMLNPEKKYGALSLVFNVF
ncbi:hypothetical protein [Mucilaginibacter polytrichastri]|uniref:Uncharacterized protein n=1 Tax=Mucilaginibacter polytrichastri TaxID=1302689 RepID=A0A1Q6A6P4_9SPHI|nr:hypothetical protein [Mucilaginibacter polytrichastri]OKS89674.1 hypothetical protein RG47T_5159 [Mucilaginibacter polytrichastri]SFT24943.1 hypothetical protein SAMN04487890_12264 [Mucilaginibacter polytrichastri]